MSAGMMIQAEGLTWPLETFLDAHRYIRTNGEVPPFHHLAGAVHAIMNTGEVRENVELSSIAWHDCLAVRVPSDSMRIAYCHACDASIVPVKIINVVGGKIAIEQEPCGGDGCDGDWEFDEWEE